jgi:hypothetical protein
MRSPAALAGLLPITRPMVSQKKFAGTLKEHSRNKPLIKREYIFTDHKFLWVGLRRPPEKVLA